MAVVYEAKFAGKTRFGMAIESTIKMLTESGKYMDIREDTECVELSKIISGMTGGKVKVLLGAFDYVNAWAKIPLLDNNNPLIVKSMTTAREKIDGDLDYRAFKKAHPDLVGGFDFDKNKFTGWATKLDFEICLGYRCVYPKKNDKDMNSVTATYILCHEFGHLIEKLFGAGTIVRDNYVLAQTHARLMGTGETAKRLKLIRSVIDEEGLKDAEEIVTSVKEGDDTAMYTILAGKCRDEIRSNLDSYGYDQTGSESLADYFATKQGYGIGALYLARPLDHPLTEDDIQYIVGWALVGAPMFAVNLAFPGAIMLAGLAYSAMAGYSYDTHASRYDSSRDRLERVVNAYIESIKSRGTAPTPHEAMELRKMTKALEDMPKNDQGVLQSIYEYVNPRGRKERDARRLQKSLESLSNHKLSLKAAEYRK